MSDKISRPNRKDVRASIVKTARQIAAEEGWSAVTVRKVAQSIGYTAPIIYEHFGSKDDMFTAILADSHKMLFLSLTEALEGLETSQDRLRAMCMAYWKFADDYPELYKLMHGMDGARCVDKEPMTYAVQTVKLVGDEIKKFNPSRINDSNVEAHVMESWAVLHGFIALEMSGYVSKYASGEKVMRMIIEDLLIALRHDSPSA